MIDRIGATHILDLSTPMQVYLLKDSVPNRARKPFSPVSKNFFKEWDFQCEASNGTPHQVNRQKSALNLTIAYWDVERRIAFFDDEKDGQSTTTINSCTCRDFNFVGNSPRKNFKPCKHIYCICFEMGILTPKHFDHRMRERIMPKVSWKERVEQVLAQLQSLGNDENRWGSWNERIHTNEYQKRRQLRAFDIIHRSPEDIADAKRGIIRDYETSLTSCTCPDFVERLVPCKHIYCLAILKSQSLPVRVEDYLEHKQEIVAECETPFIPFYDIKTDDES